MGDTIRHIDDSDLEAVAGWLTEALDESDARARHERVGVAVRALTRLWSDANPDFDRDAWFPVSALLTAHWDQIQSQMTDAKLG